MQPDSMLSSAYQAASSAMQAAASGSTPPPTNNDAAYLDYVKKIYDKGCFGKWEHGLKSSKVNWSETYWDTLQAILSGKFQSDKDSQELRLFYLFSLSIDPESNKDLIQQYISSLDKEQLKDLSQELFSSLPAVMRVNILLFCPDEIWEKGLKDLFKFSHFDTCERKITPLLTEVSGNDWSLETKKVFLDRLFSKMPQERASELFFFFLLNETPAEIANLLQVCSESLCSRLTTLQNAVSLEGIKLLDEAEEKQSTFYIPYREQETPYRRRCFVKWFIENGALHPCADLIARDFNKEDWAFLEEKESERRRADYLGFFSQVAAATPAVKRQATSSPKISDFAMHWMLTAAARPCEEFNYHVSRLIDFASKFVQKNPHSVDNFYEKTVAPQDTLAAQLSDRVLMFYLNSFEPSFRSHMVRYLIARQPDKLVSCLRLMAINLRNIERFGSNPIEELFQYLEKEAGLSRILPLLLAETDSFIPLTLFAALSKKFRTAILKEILKDRCQGLNILAGWVLSLCVPSVSLLPLIRNEFLTNFYPLINEMDATLAPELYPMIRSQVQANPEALEYLESLLPIDVDLNDPHQRQKKAIEKLKKHFLTLGISHKERRNFVSGLQDDLLAGGTRVELVRILIQELPQPAWPFLFLYFPMAFCRNPYTVYVEEKSCGGAFKRVDKDAVPEMQGPVQGNRFLEMLEGVAKRAEQATSKELPELVGDAISLERFARIEGAANKFSTPRELVYQNAEEWIEMAAQTLTQMINNPFLDNNGDSLTRWAMQCLYQAACETKTIYHIVRRFMQIAIPDAFIPTMEYFAQSAFAHNREGFAVLIKECLRTASLDRPSFIASWLESYYESGASRMKPISLEQLLWSDGCVHGDVERASITRILIREMGIQFLELFLRPRPSNKLMIESLYKTDPPFAKAVFYDYLKDLCSLGNSPVEKIIIFQNLCETYESIGVNVNTLLSQERCASELETVRSWYVPENLSMFFGKNYFDPDLNWDILLFVKPDLFYPMVFKNLDSIFEDQGYSNLFSFSDFLQKLQKLGCLHEMTQKLEEHPELLQKMQAAYIKYLADAFSSAFSLRIQLPFLERLVPDWKERLMTWVRENSSQEKERAFSYGTSPTYKEIVEIFKTLSELDLLTEWLQAFRRGSPMAFQRDIDDMCSRFSESKF